MLFFSIILNKNHNILLLFIQIFFQNIYSYLLPYINIYLHMCMCTCVYGYMNTYTCLYINHHKTFNCDLAKCD